MREKKRLVIVAMSLFFLFSLLIAQYFKIQILDGEKWKTAALLQHEFIVKEPFKRGTFFADNLIKEGHSQTPQPLVFDVTKFHLYIDPLSIPEAFKSKAAETILTLASLDAPMKAEFWVKSRSRRLAKWLDRETKEAILQWWYPFAKQHKIPRNALYFVTDYQRSHPFGELLGQVLHTIREMKDETTSECFPTGGLEAYFNEELKGKQGTRKLLRSPLNHLEIDKVIEPPEDGADIYLTINHYIQAIAEEELEKGVKIAQAKGGWAVMMDPVSGEILALAQYPFFDPANYRNYFNDAEKIEDAKVKSVTDAFELGSIMKPITVALGMKANEELAAQGKKEIFHPLDKIDVTRSIFPGRANKPLKDLSRHKVLNMYMALQKSSNVYMAQVVDRIIETLGNNWYRKALVETFGFGEKTGIELPAEACGMVPKPGKIYPNGALEWSLPTPYSLSIGYNLLATSLQMLRAYAVFANGGYLPKPTLIKKIVKKDQVILDQTRGKREFPRVLSEQIVKEVIRGIKYSTKPGGTGHLAEINGFSDAGKTGTAEKIVSGVYSKKRCISSFVGFAPASLDKTPPARFVLIVTIDEPEPIFLEGGIKNYLGGRCAAPVFREIAKRTLEFLGVIPDDPCGYPVGDPRHDSSKADWMQQVKELKLLYEQWNNS